jgi:succinate dehydrogenase / fumarate reductase, membrane anchor subunit
MTVQKRPGERKRPNAAARFWRQRFSSMLLLPLTLFAIGLGVLLFRSDHPTVAATLGQPAVASLLLAFIVLVAYHMCVGMNEIIEDYVHGPATRRLALAGNVAFAVIVVAASGYAILNLAIWS